MHLKVLNTTLLLKGKSRIAANKYGTCQRELLIRSNLSDLVSQKSWYVHVLIVKFGIHLGCKYARKLESKWIFFVEYFILLYRSLGDTGER